MTIAALVLLTSLAAPPAPVADAPPLAQRVEAAAQELGAVARARADPLPRGERKPLRAVVMTVSGRAQWRPNDDSAWIEARVDDLLDPGARIRTGRKSSLVLRVGQNASIMIDRHSRVALPRVLQEGDTLRTVVEVSRGRADFKVDRVGLTNDFSVVTPSTTLSVRGTGFAVDYGGLEGTRITAARQNEIRSIEVKYFLSRFSYALSARAVASDTHPNPAVAQLFESYGPPPLVSSVVEIEATPELLSASLSNPVRDARSVDLADAGVEASDPGQMYDFSLPPWVQEHIPPGDVVEFICTSLQAIFDQYELILGIDGLGANGLGALESEVHDICLDFAPFFQDDDPDRIVDAIIDYCVQRHAPSAEDVQRCVTDFYKAVVDEYDNQNPPP